MPDVKSDGSARQIAKRRARERLRVAGIAAMCKQHSLGAWLRDFWIESGVSLDEAAQKTLDILSERSAWRAHRSLAERIAREAA